MAQSSFSWGEPSLVNISQNKIDNLIKQYVDTHKQKEVQRYENFLQMQRETKIAKYADKTFVHNNLMWQDQKINSTQKMNIVELKVYCRDLVLANRKDWRAPSYYELMELIDYTKSNPSTIAKIKNIQSDFYLSSSKQAKEKSKEKNYWVVDFQTGVSDTRNESEQFYIRCVRTLSNKKGEY